MHIYIHSTEAGRFEVLSVCQKKTAEKTLIQSYSATSFFLVASLLISGTWSRSVIFHSLFTSKATATLASLLLMFWTLKSSRAVGKQV